MALNIVILIRNVSKKIRLKAKAELRHSDYDAPKTLSSAWSQIDKLLHI
ncbi:hypothetical protein [Acinetobacter sp. ANC 4779]|nr:hypothetical protein [Acinetobacter sp. ANC 4779]